jgi:hypothetical protein
MKDTIIPKAGLDAVTNVRRTVISWLRTESRKMARATATASGADQVKLIFKSFFLLA